MKFSNDSSSVQIMGLFTVGKQWLYWICLFLLKLLRLPFNKGGVTKAYFCSGHLCSSPNKPPITLTLTLILMSMDKVTCLMSEVINYELSFTDYADYDMRLVKISD